MARLILIFNGLPQLPIRFARLRTSLVLTLGLGPFSFGQLGRQPSWDMRRAVSASSGEQRVGEQRVGEQRVGERRVAVAAAETLSVHGGAVGASRGDVVVLLIPGPVGSAFSMRKVVRELQTRGIEPWVVDPLGMGASTRPKGADYTLSAQAARIAKVLDTELPLGVTVIVAAQGTSATIAFHLAATDTARVRGVVSLAGGPIDKQGTSGVRTALTFAALLDNPIGRSFAKRRFVSALRDQSADDRWLTDDVVKQYVAPIENDLRGLLRTLGAMQAAVEPFPIESRLARIAVPIQLLIGDKVSSSAPTVAQVRLLRTLVQRFTLDTLRPGGTMLHEERAGDVARAIDDMVRREMVRGEIVRRARH